MKGSEKSAKNEMSDEKSSCDEQDQPSESGDDAKCTTPVGGEGALEGLVSDRGVFSVDGKLLFLLLILLSVFSQLFPYVSGEITETVLRCIQCTVIGVVVTLSVSYVVHRNCFHVASQKTGHKLARDAGIQLILGAMIMSVVLVLVVDVLVAMILISFVIPYNGMSPFEILYSLISWAIKIHVIRMSVQNFLAPIFSDAGDRKSFASYYRNRYMILSLLLWGLSLLMGIVGIPIIRFTSIW